MKRKMKKIESKIKKQSKYIPLYHILGELHPVKRQILLDHLDTQSCNALCKDLNHLMVEAIKTKSKISKSTFNDIKSHIAKNKPQFKAIVNPSSKSKQKKKALLLIGGGPLALLLSALVPFVLGQVVKSK